MAFSRLHLRRWDPLLGGRLSTNTDLSSPAKAIGKPLPIKNKQADKAIPLKLNGLM
jgi:hypothetical protein